MTWRLTNVWIIGILLVATMPIAQAGAAEAAVSPQFFSAEQSPGIRQCSYGEPCQPVACQPAADACSCDPCCGNACACVNSCCSPCDGCGCGGSNGYGRFLNGQKTPWSAWLFGGPSYTSGATGAMGMSESVTVGYRMFDAFGIYGGAGFNHVASNTQILGTIGFQRFGNPNGNTLGDRTSFWMMWDQYTDDSSNYRHQFRFMLGYVPSERTNLGIAYTVPTSDDGGAGTIPLGGPGMITMGKAFIGPYMSIPVGDTDMYGTLGYSDATDNVGLGLGVKRPLNDRFSVFADVKYGGDKTFGGTVGLAMGLGRMDTNHY